MATVVIVDDTVFMRATLKKVLSDAGFQVVGEAENGQVGVERYQELHPDVIMLDITMPIMDGLAALQEIKKINPDAAVIMCTALGQERIVMQALEYGAKDYIIKPFKPEKVVEAVQKAAGAAVGA
jgi:two-component system, chemotaxis family, chemotaxis protein CheY